MSATRLDLPENHPRIQKRAIAVPSPWGRISLLAIAQRTIHVSRHHISTNRKPRKPVPTTLKTLGDHIHIKRYEKRLSLSQVADYVGVTMTVIKSFESDAELPNDSQLQSLQKLLGLDPRLKTTKPNT
jgi:ribosome-binding protein aMBF1 (putative translation factor)